MPVAVANRSVLEKTVELCKERNIIIPTFAQQKDPAKVPDKIKKKLKPVGLWDVDPINLFRITWKNDVKTGLFGGRPLRSAPGGSPGS